MINAKEAKRLTIEIKEKMYNEDNEVLKQLTIVEFNINTAIQNEQMYTTFPIYFSRYEIQKVLAILEAKNYKGYYNHPFITIRWD